MSKSKFIFANCIRWSCVSFSNGVIDGAEKSPLDFSNAWESKTRGNLRPIAIGGVVSVGYLESCSILHVERKDKYKSTDLWQSPKWAVTNCFWWYRWRRWGGWILHVEREDDWKSKDSRQPPKCSFTNCNRWSCVALLNDSIDGAEEVVKTLHVKREDDSKFKKTRQSPKCAVTNCNMWSCVALLNDRIDGVICVSL